MRGLGVSFHMFAAAARIHRKRMALTVAAIAWGTVSVVLMLSFGEGLRRQLQKGLDAFGTDFAILWPRETGRPYRGLPPGRQIRLEIEDVDRLRAASSHVARAAGEIVDRNVPLARDATTLNVRVSAVHPDYALIRKHATQPGGRLLSPLDERLKRRVIVLGDALKDKLFGAGPAVGRTVTLGGADYTVIGVLAPKPETLLHEGPDAESAFIPISTYRDRFGTRHLRNITFQPVSPDRMENALRDAFTLFGRRYQFDPADDQVFFVLDPRAFQEPAVQAVSIVEIFLGVVGALTLAVGGLGVANVMMAVVKERTREIGVQMALGARRSWIAVPLLLEGLFQTLLGGAAGTAVGWGAVALVRLAPTAGNEALAFLSQPSFSPLVALTTAGMLGAVGLLAGFIPARRAARINPVEALRYE